jgi:predicted CXXCH cytochrome family protein
VLLVAAWRERRAVATDLQTPRDLHGGEHAGSTACRRCHADHFASWHRTYHRTMTADVPSAVAGDFSGVRYRYGGVEARMDRDAGGAFRMTFTPDDGGAVRQVTVLRTVGSRRYQQYLTSIGDSFYRLPMAYHIEEQRWFHMNGAFLTPDPGPRAPEDHEASHQQPRFGGGAYDRHVTRWNDNCVFCHNVGPNPGHDPDLGTFRTEVAELGIACESCHGPGGEHARRNQDPVRRYALHLGETADPTIVNPGRLTPRRSADLCGRCHGQRITDDVGRFLTGGDPFVPGDDLALYSAPLWRDTPLAGDREAFAARFWADGTARLTAYEYQGLLQSPCTQRGALTCTSCHGMHEGDPRGQIRPAARQDLACTGCHTALATDQAKGRHARHQAGGAGARCLSCHMPRVVYGVLDVHRSHRIEIPDPAAAARMGRPDACTACHVDQTVGWAITETARLWDRPRQGEEAREKAAATERAGPAGGDGPLTALFAGDPIERVVAADALGRAEAPASQMAIGKRLGVLLDVMAEDSYPAVRHLAWRAARRLVERHHPAQAVRFAATYDPTGEATARRRALDETRASLPPAAIISPDPSRATRLRAQAAEVNIEIGE